MSFTPKSEAPVWRLWLCGHMAQQEQLYNCAPASYLLEALETGRNYANNFAAAQYSLAIFLSWRIL